MISMIFDAINMVYFLYNSANERHELIRKNKIACKQLMNYVQSIEKVVKSLCNININQYQAEFNQIIQAIKASEQFIRRHTGQNRLQKIYDAKHTQSYYQEIIQLLDRSIHILEFSIAASSIQLINNSSGINKFLHDIQELMSKILSLCPSDAPTFLSESVCELRDQELKKLLNMGISCLGYKLYQDALTCFDFILNCSTMKYVHINNLILFEAHRFKASALTRLNRYSEALQSINEALHICPDHADALRKKQDCINVLTENQQMLCQQPIIGVQFTPLLNFVTALNPNSHTVAPINTPIATNINSNFYRRLVGPIL